MQGPLTHPVGNNIYYRYQLEDTTKALDTSKADSIELKAEQETNLSKRVLNVSNKYKNLTCKGYHFKYIYQMHWK